MSKNIIEHLDELINILSIVNEEFIIDIKEAILIIDKIIDIMDNLIIELVDLLEYYKHISCYQRDSIDLILEEVSIILIEYLIIIDYLL